MIRFLLVHSRRGVIIIEEEEFKQRNNGHRGDPEPGTTGHLTYRAWTKTEAMEGMGALGLQYKSASVGRYKTEYYDVTEEQAVLVKMFMQ